jgi:hypothetical protein
MNRTTTWMAALAIAGVAALGIAALSSSMALARDRDDDRPERRSAEDFDWSGRVPAGGHVGIKGIHGDIEARPSRDGRVHVTAVKRWKRDDPDEVRIVVEEDGKGITICAIYPGGTDCDQPMPRGRNESNDVSVHFTVEVPADAELQASTVNGDVDALDLESDARLTTVNGSIEVETTGVAQANTVNGSIRASIGSDHWPESLDFTTVNGSITLLMSEEPDARVNATTVNGSISTDFALKVRGKFGPRSLSGTLGRGGPLLNLTTVNGAISLREGS